MRAKSRPDPGGGGRRYHARMDPEMERECGRIETDLTAGPISTEEYKRLLYVRRSGEPQPSTPWIPLLCRFHRHFPNTIEREMWHEAGHAVVAYYLGCQVKRIRRDHDGTPGAVIKRRDGWEGIDEGTLTVAGWLAEAMKAYPELTDPTDEVAQHAMTFRTPEGEKMPPHERIKYIQIAEQHAQVILKAHWDAVERIATRAMKYLPVEKGELRRLLEGVGRCSTPPMGQSNSAPSSGSAARPTTHGGW
jgi:hypothetical protein